ncbi:hypothetical protein IWX90DRAFT_192141 [Phyllosticta citrichinensis]|uniref:Uncharacterized protein n=1 Tax=Phyllosticta citrichinensis TaxID=1130410 RepID=A0ABR1XX68_9PEZI
MSLSVLASLTSFSTVPTASLVYPTFPFENIDGWHGMAPARRAESESRNWKIEAVGIHEWVRKASLAVDTRGCCILLGGWVDGWLTGLSVLLCSYLFFFFFSFSLVSGSVLPLLVTFTPLCIHLFRLSLLFLLLLGVNGSGDKRADDAIMHAWAGGWLDTNFEFGSFEHLVLLVYLLCLET